MIAVITNHRPRPLMSWHELTPAQRADYGEEANEYNSFFVYQGATYPLNAFMACAGIAELADRWHAYDPDSYFSGVVVRVCEDDDAVIVGRYYAD